MEHSHAVSRNSSHESLVENSVDLCNVGVDCSWYTDFSVKYDQGNEVWYYVEEHYHGGQTFGSTIWKQVQDQQPVKIAGGTDIANDVPASNAFVAKVMGIDVADDGTIFFDNFVCRRIFFR